MSARADGAATVAPASTTAPITRRDGRFIGKLCRMLRAMSPRLGVRALATVIALAGGCRDVDVDRMDGLARKACACKTAACADAVVHEVGAAPVAATRKTEALAKELLDCVARRHEEELPPDDASAAATAAAPGSAAGSSATDR